MVETMAGIWLFLLTAIAGFVAGRVTRKSDRRTRSPKREVGAADPGLQQLLNFLQYDGSGLPYTKEKTERVNRGVETQYDTSADTDRIYPRRAL